MLDRLVGLETEYVLRFRPRRPGGRRVPNGDLYRRLLNSLRARGPLAQSIAGDNSWFLANGGGLKFERLPFYGPLPTSGFVEGATPECRGPVEILRYQRAQDVLLSRYAASSGGADGYVTLLKSSHDADGHLFGSHENYEATVADGPGLWAWRAALVPAIFVVAVAISVGDVAALLLGPMVAAPVALAGRLFGRDAGRTYSAIVARLVSLCRTPGQLAGSAFTGLLAFRRVRRRLLAFLVSRTIVSGPGMVRPDGRFVLSARADAVRSTCGITAAAWRSVFSFCHVVKAVADPADGGVSVFRRRQRLQVTIGDSNMAQHAEFLKVGTTLLVLDVIEAGGARRRAPPPPPPAGSAGVLRRPRPARDRPAGRRPPRLCPRHSAVLPRRVPPLRRPARRGRRLGGGGPSPVAGDARRAAARPVATRGPARLGHEAAPPRRRGAQLGRRAAEARSALPRAVAGGVLPTPGGSGHRPRRRGAGGRRRGLRPPPRGLAGRRTRTPHPPVRRIGGRGAGRLVLRDRNGRQRHAGRPARR